MNDDRPNDWFTNDAFFFSQLEKGHRWAKVVCERLVGAGLHARVTEMTKRATIDDRHEYADEFGILVGERDPIIGPYAFE